MVAPLVVCIGAVTFDLVAAVNEPLGDDGRVIAPDAVVASGGPAATAAVTLARLQIPSAFAGTVGDDDAGAFVREGLIREGVDISGVRVAAGRTAMSSIVVHRESAHRSIAAFYGTVGTPVLLESTIEMCRHAAWIHVDHIGFSVVGELRSHGVATPVSVDAGNPTPGLDLRHVALYAPTERRLFEHFPAGDLAAAMRSSLGTGAATVVVTRGPAGSLGMTRDAAWGVAAGELVEAEAFEVPVSSTLGAGDVFHGALLAARVRGRGLYDSLLIANAVASLSCRGLDGRSAIPGWNEAISFIASRSGADGTETEAP